jgi:hypothetical protein
MAVQKENFAYFSYERVNEWHTNESVPPAQLSE